jgi:hypothetical protein
LSDDSEELPLTPSEQESWYDAEIAPKLLEMGNACADRGIPFLAVVGYDGAIGSSGRTCCFPEQTPFFFRVLDMAARCWEDGGTFNLDRFCIAMARAAAGKPHDSFVLKLMGIPPEGSET